ncbi:hypothetical protein E2C01_012039 [Portunus trituberculatus]|uniref:Uncharacterized protein n=1 Tax=Portunus trituberculatus TaxID=210409 RepID=A0A5B7DCF9_PORTR|nr:hypothetical protein [Portunus trituberculatus]
MEPSVTHKLKAKDVAMPTMPPWRGRETRRATRISISVTKGQHIPNRKRPSCGALMVPKMVCPAWNTPPTCMDTMPATTPSVPVMAPTGTKKMLQHRGRRKMRGRRSSFMDDTHDESLKKSSHKMAEMALICEEYELRQKREGGVAAGN